MVRVHNHRPLVKIFNGSVRKGDKIRFFSNLKQYEVEEVGFLRLEAIPQTVLMAGDVGYLFASIREVADTKIGDTITSVANPALVAVQGFVYV